MIQSKSTGTGRKLSLFAAWLIVANSGDRFTYHTGMHLSGLYVHEVRKAYNAGLITLIQRRNGDAFDYIAVRLARTARIEAFAKFNADHLGNAA